MPILPRGKTLSSNHVLQQEIKNKKRTWSRRPAETGWRGPMTLPDGQITANCPALLSSPLAENIPVVGLPETPLGIPPSDPTEGRIAIVTDAGLDVVDAAASGAQVNCRAGFGLSQTRERPNGAQTNGVVAYGKTVWFRHPLLVSSRRRCVGPTGRGYSVNSPMTVTRRIRRRGEHEISR